MTNGFPVEQPPESRQILRAPPWHASCVVQVLKPPA
jgi:hypothetical protein